jgi:hypothetical protein
MKKIIEFFSFDKFDKVYSERTKDSDKTIIFKQSAYFSLFVSFDSDKKNKTFFLLSQ